MRPIWKFNWKVHLAHTVGKLKTTPRRRSARTTGGNVNFLGDFSLRLASVHHRRGALRLFAFNRLKSHLLPVPYAILPDALPRRRATGIVVGRLLQPRRVVRRQNRSRAMRDVISDAFANNARSLQFAVVIYGVIRPLSSTQLGVYCICRRCCIVHHDDNAIRDANATLTKATSRWVVCALFALYLSTVNVNLIFIRLLDALRYTTTLYTNRKEKFSSAIRASFRFRIRTNSITNTGLVKRKNNTENINARKTYLRYVHFFQN